MINLKEALADLNITCSGVIHVGGHKAQEYQEYKDAGLTHQVWIEANPHFFYEIINVIREDDNCVALKEHLKYYPNIRYDGYLQMTTKRLDKIIEDSSIDLSKHNGLVMDVQGVELRVLKSLGSLLNNFKFVQSEVNLEELYEGCCLIDELDEYLKSFGFERKITKLWDDGAVGWGDALYIKND
jgi:hypothetical protein